VREEFARCAMRRGFTRQYLLLEHLLALLHQWVRFEQL
jgi:hypothetical protein